MKPHTHFTIHAKNALYTSFLMILVCILLCVAFHWRFKAPLFHLSLEVCGLFGSTKAAKAALGPPCRAVRVCPVVLVRAEDRRRCVSESLWF